MNFDFYYPLLLAAGGISEDITFVLSKLLTRPTSSCRNNPQIPSGKTMKPFMFSPSQSSVPLTFTTEINDYRSHCR